jgi:hypothetical protein
MEKADDFRVSLCVRHPALRPEAISASLHVEPQLSWGVGDVLGGRVRSSTLWHGTLVEGSGEAYFESALESVLAMLATSESLLRRITSSDGDVSLSIRLVAAAQDGKAAEMRLNTPFLQALAQLNIELVFEVWMSGVAIGTPIPELAS